MREAPSVRTTPESLPISCVGLARASGRTARACTACGRRRTSSRRSAPRRSPRPRRRTSWRAAYRSAGESFRSPRAISGGTSRIRRPTNTAGEHAHDRAGLEQVAGHRGEALERHRDLDDDPRDARRRRSAGSCACASRSPTRATAARAIQIVFAFSWWKRLIVPITLLLCSSRGLFRAMLPAMKKLFAVRPGMPNQRNTSAARASYATCESRGSCASQIPARAQNGHTSGRPSDPRNHIQNATRGVREMEVDRRQAQRDDHRVGLGTEEEVGVGR